ncbi:hypothetical protein ACIP5Y_44025 [Nocardia sp. NPDC088792]|uniref:hypothetical protein n=1 Tax=Nocardia sp. NPDC088792 TaxID=3364332 RepID=UPI00381A7F17
MLTSGAIAVQVTVVAKGWDPGAARYAALGIEAAPAVSAVTTQSGLKTYARIPIPQGAPAPPPPLD